mgnify:CR=1 FL=1
MARFFIFRPVFAIVTAIVLLLAGIIVWSVMQLRRQLAPKSVGLD